MHLQVLALERRVLAVALEEVRKAIVVVRDHTLAFRREHVEHRIHALAVCGVIFAEAALGTCVEVVGSGGGDVDRGAAGDGEGSGAAEGQALCTHATML